MSYLLDGARAKIKRAKQHIQKLKRDIAIFVAQNPYTARIEKNATTGTVRIFAKASGVGEPPIDFILLAGEVAHQLRSALGHAVYALCSLRYRRAPKHLTMFPIFETRKGYEARGRAKIKDIPKTISTYIKRMQPYHRGAAAHDHPLWILHELNNADKHRLIPLTIVGAGAIHLLEVGNESISRLSIDFTPTVRPLKDGAELYTGPVSHTDFEMEMNPQLACDIAFEQIGDAKLKPIIPVLQQLVSFVDRTIYTLSVL